MTLMAQIFYSGFEIGTRYVDFLDEKKVMVELKAATEVDAVRWTQVINYLEAYGLEVGLLLNFGTKHPAADEQR